MKKNIFLSIASITICLLIIEGIIRITGVAPDVSDISNESYVFSDNPKLKYTLKPNGLLNKGKDKINKEGYRGDVYAIKKKNAFTSRIVCVGDSITLGLGVRNNETYSYFLEKELNAHNSKTKWEVINLGVNGYNTINEVEMIKTRGLSFSPDLIILQYYINDNSNMSDLNIRDFGEKLVENHRLLYFMVNPFTKFLAKSKLFLFCAVRFKTLKISNMDTFKWWKTSDYFYEGNIVSNGLKDFKRLSVKYHFKPLVLISPEFEFKNNFNEYQNTYKEVINLCEENDLDYLDLLSCLKDRHNENARNFHIDEGHPTPYGHRIIAEILGDEINRMFDSAI